MEWVYGCLGFSIGMFIGFYFKSSKDGYCVDVSALKKINKEANSFTAPAPPPARRPPVNVLVSIDEMVYVEIDGKAIYCKVVGINHDGVVISYGKDKPIKKIFNNSQIYKTKE